MLNSKALDHRSALHSEKRRSGPLALVPLALVCPGLVNHCSYKSDTKTPFMIFEIIRFQGLDMSLEERSPGLTGVSATIQSVSITSHK